MTTYSYYDNTVALALAASPWQKAQSAARTRAMGHRGSDAMAYGDAPGARRCRGDGKPRVENQNGKSL